MPDWVAARVRQVLHAGELAVAERDMLPVRHVDLERRVLPVESALVESGAGVERDMLLVRQADLDRRVL